MNNKNIILFSNVNIIISIIAFFNQIYVLIADNLDCQKTIFILLFSALTILTIIGQRRYFTPSFLLSSFFIIVTLRLSSLSNISICIWLYIFTLAIQFLIFIIYCNQDLKLFKDKVKAKEKLMLFQLIFIRIYIGYDLIPHFCEKLFAGDAIRNIDVSAFTTLGVPNPLFFVYMAGIIEFLGSLAVSCGFLIRFSSFGLVLYLLIATFLGHHFSLGFIWAGRGGGWEFPILWSVIILSFGFIKPTLFTIDEFILKNFRLAKTLRGIMEY
ncbi:MAG: DoxX family protein [Candidatus Midichloriaceae bacterium]